jgi:hypothetical protein
MLKMITLPLLVLFLVVFYFFFESHIMRAATWATGDALVSWYAVTRLEENGEVETLTQLTRSPFSKTRYFAIQACDRLNLAAGLKSLITLADDPDWEVRMKAIAIAKKRSYKPAGAAFMRRLLRPPPNEDSQRRRQLESAALIGVLGAVAAPENSEELSQLALLKKNVHLARVARDALWPLGPLPQAEATYQAILNEPGKYHAQWEDSAACLEAAAVLDLPGALENILKLARESTGKVRLRAIHALGSLGGEGGKKYLQSIVNAPEWRRKTDADKARIKEAEKALERIRRKEQGLPDLDSEPPVATTGKPPPEKSPGDEDLSVEDLLDSYGSDATPSTSGAAGGGQEESIEDLLAEG